MNVSTAGNAVGKDVAGIGSTGGIAAETVKPGQTKITIEIAPNGLTATAGVKQQYPAITVPSRIYRSSGT